MLGDTSWLSCDFIAQVFLGYKANKADEEIIVFFVVRDIKFNYVLGVKYRTL